MKHRDGIDLAALLEKLFDGGELRRWVYEHIGLDVYNALPQDVNLAELAFQTARILERHGRIDCDFWQALKQTRPQHAACIRETAKCWPGPPVVEVKIHRRRTIQIGVAIAIFASMVIGGFVLINSLGSETSTTNIANPTAVDADVQVKHPAATDPTTVNDASIQENVPTVSSEVFQEPTKPSDDIKTTPLKSKSSRSRSRVYDSRPVTNRTAQRPQPVPDERPSSALAGNAKHDAKTQEPPYKF